MIESKSVGRNSVYVIIREEMSLFIVFLFLSYNFFLLHLSSDLVSLMRSLKVKMNNYLFNYSLIIFTFTGDYIIYIYVYSSIVCQVYQ